MGIARSRPTLTSGALVGPLETHSAASQATLDFTSWYSADYDEYVIEVLNLKPATDNVYLYMRMSTDGGSSYDSGTNYDSAQGYVYTGGAGVAGATGNSLSAMRLFDTIGNGGSYAVSGTFRLFEPGSSARYKTVLGQNHFYHATVGGLVAGYGSHVYKSTTAINAFRFLFSSGNITSGTIRVYGIAK